ncbi:MAG: TIM barrel protein [Caldilineaceae bacterium]
MSTIHPGLVSITFRKLTPAEIIALVVQAQLSAIEWGGDVHVPHGDAATAQIVRRQTVDAGLQVAAYGSYYRVSHEETGPFDKVLAAAVALGAPTIRVWAGRQGSAVADEAYWQAVVEDSQRIADLAAAEEIKIAYEFHRNTLTDTNDSARRLLEAVAHPNVRSYWQPPRYSTVAYNLAGIATVAPWLEDIHLFQWHRVSGEREPLAAGADDWQFYLDKISELDADRYALLEFVAEDSPANFLRDATTLLSWLTR